MGAIGVYAQGMEKEDADFWIKPIPSQTFQDDSDDPSTLALPSSDSVECRSIVAVDTEKIFLESEWGARAFAQSKETLAETIKENKRLQNQLEREEKELTAIKPTLSPEEFAERAKKFSAKADRIRDERNNVEDQRINEFEAEKNKYLRAALPVIGEVMQRHSACVAVYKDSVAVMLNSIDVTGEVIEESNRKLGDGSDIDP